MRRLSATLATLAVVLATVGLTAAPASAAGPGLVLEGRGYGHGIGMSQYGALGRANAGQGYAQILAAYYPGTTLATGSDTAPVRVLVESDTDRVTQIRGEQGLSLRTTGGTVALPTSIDGVAASQWRLRTVAGAFVLEVLTGTTWRSPGTAGVSSILLGASYADLAATDGTVQLVLGSTYRQYTGTARAAREGTTQRTVIVTTYASYLPSVVTSEMPSSWHAQALAAQAVAARSYAMFDQRSKLPSAIYDTCDTTRCQVFNGDADYDAAGTLVRSSTTPTTRAAVSTTAGRYLAHGGAPAFTQFSASNGGYSVAGSRPYLVAAADPFDGLATWRLELSGERIESAYPQIGRLRQVTALRDGRGDYGGRVTSLTLTGSAGSVTVTGNAVRSTFGLRSTLFALAVDEQEAPERELTGDGIPDVIARDSDGRLFLWPGRQEGTLGTAAQIGYGWSSIGATTMAIDVAGGGGPELVAVDRSRGGLWSYPWNGSSFGTRVAIGSRGWTPFDVLLYTTDFAGPGTSGIIARQRTTGTLYYYPVTLGALGAARKVGSGWNGMTSIVRADDWNADGRPDLLATSPDGRLWFYAGTGAGGVRSGVQIGHGWSTMSDLVGGVDWSGDGHPDLLAQDTLGRLWVYPGDGTGGFLARQQLGAGWSAYSFVP